MSFLRRFGFALAGGLVPVVTGIVKFAGGDVVGGAAALAAGVSGVVVELLKTNESPAGARGLLRPTVETYLETMRRDYSIIALVPASAVLIGMGSRLFGESPALAFFASVLAFSAFDAVVFFHVHDVRGRAALWIPNDELMRSRAYYRIVQTTIQHTIGLFLLFVVGWQTMSLFYFFWIMGGCDWLYYALLRQPAIEGDMWWLAWTIPGRLGFRSWRSLKWASLIAVAVCAVALFFIFS